MMNMIHINNFKNIKNIKLNVLFNVLFKTLNFYFIHLSNKHIHISTLYKRRGVKVGDVFSDLGSLDLVEYCGNQ